MLELLNILPLAQFDPAPPPSSGGSVIGTLIWMVLLGLVINTLFGFWGKSRAEDSGVNPWVGFALGFFLGFIGILIVPVFRTDRVIVTRNPNPQPLPSQPNPMYSAGGPPPSQPNPMHNAGGPPPSQPNPMYAPAAPPPHAHENQPQQPAPQQPEQILVADDHGYVECPHCGARTKANRKACMTCGNFLPAIYDPNIS